MITQPCVCIVPGARPSDGVRVKTNGAAHFVDLGCEVSWLGSDESSFAHESWRNSVATYDCTKPIHTKLDSRLSPGGISRRAQDLRALDWYGRPLLGGAHGFVAAAKRPRGRAFFGLVGVCHGAPPIWWLSGSRAEAALPVLRRRVATTCRGSARVVGANGSVLRPGVRSGRKSRAVCNCPPRLLAESVPERAARAPPTAMTFLHGVGLVDIGTPVVPKVLSRLPTKSAAVRIASFASPDARTFLFMPAIRRKFASLRREKVALLKGLISLERMISVFARCDVRLGVHGRGFGEYSIPTRLLEHWASALSVLAPSCGTQVKRMVDEELIRLAVKLGGPVAVATAMQWFVGNPDGALVMGECAQSALLKRHRRNVELEKPMDVMAGFEG